MCSREFLEHILTGNFTISVFQRILETYNDWELYDQCVPENSSVCSREFLKHILTGNFKTSVFQRILGTCFNRYPYEQCVPENSWNIYWLKTLRSVCYREFLEHVLTGTLTNSVFQKVLETYIDWELYNQCLPENWWNIYWLRTLRSVCFREFLEHILTGILTNSVFQRILETYIDWELYNECVPESSWKSYWIRIVHCTKE